MVEVCGSDGWDGNGGGLRGLGGKGRRRRDFVVKARTRPRRLTNI